MDRSDYTLMFGILFFAAIGGIVLAEKLQITPLYFISLALVPVSFIGFTISRLLTGHRAIGRLGSAGRKLHARIFEKNRNL